MTSPKDPPLEIRLSPDGAHNARSQDSSQPTEYLRRITTRSYSGLELTTQRATGPDVYLTEITIRVLL